MEMFNLRNKYNRLQYKPFINKRKKENMQNDEYNDEYDKLADAEIEYFEVYFKFMKCIKSKCRSQEKKMRRLLTSQISSNVSNINASKRKNEDEIKASYMRCVFLESCKQEILDEILPSLKKLLKLRHEFSKSGLEMKNNNSSRSRINVEEAKFQQRINLLDNVENKLPQSELSMQEKNELMNLIVLSAV